MLATASSVASSSKLWSKWSPSSPCRAGTMMSARFPTPRLFDAVLDNGLVHQRQHLLGITLVAGKKRVPRPPAEYRFATRLFTLLSSSRQCSDHLGLLLTTLTIIPPNISRLGTYRRRRQIGKQLVNLKQTSSDLTAVKGYFNSPAA